MKLAAGGGVVMVETAWYAMCLLTYSTITDNNSSISKVIAAPFISIRHFLKYKYFKRWHNFPLRSKLLLLINVLNIVI